MARNKNPNIINWQDAREFMNDVYGLKSKVMTPYELMIIHEEFMGKFHWYHTTGKLLCVTKGTHGEQQYNELPRSLTDEDTAIAIEKHVEKMLKKSYNRFYWDKSHKREHRDGLNKLLGKIQTA